MTRRSRLGLALLTLVALLAAAHSAAWLVASNQILQNLPTIRAAATEEGWTLDTGAATRTGWPLAATIRLANVSARRTLDAAGTLAWSADHLDVSLRPNDVTALHLTTAGPQRLTAGDAPPLALDLTAADLRIPLDGDAPLHLVATGLQATIDAQTSHAQTLQAAQIEARFDPVALAGSATGLTVAPPLPPPFDRPATFSLRAVTAPPLPFRGTAADWRAAGGTVEIREMALDDGTLKASGHLEAKLDSALQPALQGTLRVEGAPAMLDAAARAGLVAPGPASAIKAVLAVLTLGARGGPVDLPVTLRDRTLAVAQFPLLRVPAIQWGPP